MKMYVISDNIDTCTGMRLAGIDGCVAHSNDEVTAAIDTVVKNSDIAILLITQKAISAAPEYVSAIKLERSVPLIVAIPDRHGIDKNSNAITDYIRDAIGLKI